MQISVNWCFSVFFQTFLTWSLSFFLFSTFVINYLTESPETNTSLQTFIHWNFKLLFSVQLLVLLETPVTSCFCYFFASNCNLLLFLTPILSIDFCIFYSFYSVFTSMPGIFWFLWACIKLFFISLPHFYEWKKIHMDGKL